ncbi:hypothetical protein KCU65_g5695, partial [Aureobasidium melanogenum]
MSYVQLTPEELELAREQVQFMRDQRALDMPFLNEELPFLAEFDDHPYVSVDRVLNILKEENSAPTTAAETATGNGHDLGALNTPGVSFDEFVAGLGPHTTSTAPETDPDMDMLDASEIGDDDRFAPNPASGTNPSTASSSGATPGAAAPDGSAFKKSCKICATRKIKCEIIAGSTPRLCKFCQEKGLACEFELKKSRQQAQA